MTEDALSTLLPQLEAFHARFHPSFCRAEGSARSQQSLVGLLLPLARKHVENITEQVAAPPCTLQAFVSESPWDDGGGMTARQRAVREPWGAPNGVLIVEDTGFPQQGTCSAGVGRQDSGTLGRTDTGQGGAFGALPRLTAIRSSPGGSPCWQSGVRPRRGRGVSGLESRTTWGCRRSWRWGARCCRRPMTPDTCPSSG